MVFQRTWNFEQTTRSGGSAKSAMTPALIVELSSQLIDCRRLLPNLL